MSFGPAIPPYGAGQHIGLLGGSFNPPHEAHRAISLYAMKRLRLDGVWWLVSPGNPLKADAPRDFAARIAAATHVAHHPRIAVSGFEAEAGTRYTIDTLRALSRRCVTARFVWIMGADNLTQFHRWRDWQGIAHLMPLAVVDRASQGLRALASPAALAMAKHRIPEAEAASLPGMKPPVWTFLTGLKLKASSTALRRANGSWIPGEAP
jgi:nicotinate-nucleotide adenylyltransferase